MSMMDIVGSLNSDDTEEFAGLCQALFDASQLLAIYEEKENDGEDSVLETYSALLRGSLILVVAAWETYIEETLKILFDTILDKAETIKDVQAAFNTTAKSRYRILKYDMAKDMNREEFVSRFPDAVGDDWKIIISKSFDDEVSKLHSPKYTNLRSIFKDYLGINIGEIWASDTKAREKILVQLEKIIDTRNSIAHRVSDYPWNTAASKEFVENAIYFIKDLGTSTESLRRNT